MKLPSQLAVVAGSSDVTCSDGSQPYTTVAGDQCWTIVYDNDISPDVFFANNLDLDCSSIFVGTHVCLTGSASPTSASSASTSSLNKTGIPCPALSSDRPEWHKVSLAQRACLQYTIPPLPCCSDACLELKVLACMRADHHHQMLMPHEHSCAYTLTCIDLSHVHHSLAAS